MAQNRPVAPTYRKGSARPDIGPWRRQITRSSVRTTLLALSMAVVVYALWQDVVLVSSIPRASLLIASLVILLLSARSTPAVALLLVALSTASILWSMAPGHSLVWTLWAAIFAASMVLGRSMPAFVALNVALLYIGLEKALALNYFGLASYLSGSVHYVTGAQALVLIPLAFATMQRSRRWWLVLAAYPLLVVATYAALISGARAVYVPLLVFAVVLPIRGVVGGARWPRTLGVVAVLIVGLWSLDRAIPVPQAQSAPFAAAVPSDEASGASPLTEALSTKATPEAQAAGLSEYGGIRNRLRLWHQALAIGINNPLGAGAGSFPAVLHSYQRYPMAWSNSAHNVFLELFAELGWLGVMLLGVLVFLPMLVVFLSGGWPIALSLFGIWFTLSVDVTSSHAYMMALAFAVLGATYAAVPKELRPGWKRLLGSTSPAVQVLVVGAVVCIALWWFLPCVSAGCATVRYRGHPAIAAEAYRAASPQERELLLADLRELYPQSMWVVHLAAIHAVDRTERLELTRELSTRFPYLSPEHYMTWARDAFAANDREEALRALESGFVIFPADRLPFGEMRMSPERYRTTWVEPATRLLGQLQ